MSGAFTPHSDPALDRGGDGRSLLQSRLALYGKVLILQSLGYWTIYLITWALEPLVSFEEAWRHVLSADVLLLTTLYGLFWIIGRGRARTASFLVVTDVAGNAAIGIALAFLMLSDLGALSGVFENLMALVSLLVLRAIIVPSPVSRTILSGVLMSLPTVAGVGFGADRFAGESITGAAMMGFAINWSGIAVVFSSVASGVLYGLRRQVRDARRLGQYTLLEKLGEGGMGVVYRASHAMLRRPTAIKLLSRGGNGSLERFEREVQLLATMNHPNTVTIHDYGRTADGTFYYAMELLDGLDLEKLVTIDGPQPAGRVIHLLRQAARALAEAHQMGLVHRDVKPANIFLCKRWGEPDVVKVLDFGLAKDLSAGSGLDITGSRTVLGTPLYISPEALADSSAADARSDIYSLGAVAYYLLAGVAVFEGRSAVEICAHHIHKRPVPPSERSGRAVPRALEELVLRCLAKSPRDRHQTATELGAALDKLAASHPWTAGDAKSWWAAQNPDGAPDTTRTTMSVADTVLIDLQARRVA